MYLQNTVNQLYFNTKEGEKLKEDKATRASKKDMQKNVLPMHAAPLLGKCLIIYAVLCLVTQLCLAL